MHRTSEAFRGGNDVLFGSVSMAKSSIPEWIIVRLITAEQLGWLSSFAKHAGPSVLYIKMLAGLQSRCGPSPPTSAVYPLIFYWPYFLEHPLWVY
jgi:hypothetical protein